MNLPVIITGGQLPGGAAYCVRDPQSFFQDMISQMSAYVSGLFAGTVISDSQPAATDQDKVWFRTVGGAPVYPFAWRFYNGLWVARHAESPNSSRRELYTGTEAGLASYDGGDGGAIGTVSATTGPMWQVDHTFDFRFPLGPGSSPAGTIVAVGDTGGEETHSLTTAEIPPHTHPTPRGSGFVIWDKTSGGIQNWTGGAYEFDLPSASGSNPSSAATGSTGGDGTNVTAHNTMPPYLATFLIKRTGRIFYTSPV